MKYLMLGIMALSLLPFVGLSEAKPVCPGGFEYSTDWIFTPENNPDKNNNGAVCFKELPNDKVIFVDDFR
jgi:hypothetical protein